MLLHGSLSSQWENRKTNTAKGRKGPRTTAGYVWSRLSRFRLHGALPDGVKEQTSGREHDIPSTLRVKNTEKDVASVPLGRLLSIWTSCISSQMQDAMSWWCCGNVPIHMTTASVIWDPGSSVILEELLTYHTQQIAG